MGISRGVTSDSLRRYITDVARFEAEVDSVVTLAKQSDDPQIQQVAGLLGNAKLLIFTVKGDLLVKLYDDFKEFAASEASTPEPRISSIEEPSSLNEVIADMKVSSKEIELAFASRPVQLLRAMPEPIQAIAKVFTPESFEAGATPGHKLMVARVYLEALQALLVIKANNVDIGDSQQLLGATPENQTYAATVNPGAQGYV